MKLDERWRIYELMRQHAYISSHGYANKPYPKKVEKSQKKIISTVKKVLKKKIEIDDFDKLDSEITDFFFKEKPKHKWGHLPLLGPIGKSYINSSGGALLDLEDIEEVYLETENFSGSIKSKTCGWIAWMLVEGDKSFFTHKSLTSEYQYLVTMNHHKIETAREEIFEKLNKYKQTKEGRTLKRFFISNRFWFHEDLDKLHKSLPYTYFLSY